MPDAEYVPDLGPEWVSVEWRNDGTKPAFIHNWQVWIKLPSLIEAVESQGYVVIKLRGRPKGWRLWGHVLSSGGLCLLHCPHYAPIDGSGDRS